MVITYQKRVAGVDLFHELLVMSAKQGFPVFLLGAKETIIQKTAETVKQLYPNLSVVGSQHGYFWGNDGKDEQASVEQIRASGAKLLFVAITSPKKKTLLINSKTSLALILLWVWVVLLM